MVRVKLSCGEAQVRIWFDEEEPADVGDAVKIDREIELFNRFWHFAEQLPLSRIRTRLLSVVEELRPPRPRKRVNVRLVGDLGYDPPIDFIATVTCSRQDKFDGRIGRKLACEKLLRMIDLRFLTKEDRAAIWAAVLPEHHFQYPALKDLTSIRSSI